MARGSFNLAVSGMLAQQDRMAVIANNISNSRTTSFKASTLSFTEEFVSHAGQFINGTHNQYGNGVRSSGVTVDWGTGAIAGTGNPSNLSITGEGFLTVAYQGSNYYTRAGDFALVEDPTSAGNYIFMRPNGAVLQGATVANAAITGNVSFSAAPTSYQMGADGVVTALPTTVVVSNLNIGVQRFNNPDSLQRIEGGLFLPTTLTTQVTAAPSAPGTSGAGTLQQGTLENSNVDLVNEFTEMIQTQRAFQANAKTITTADEMLQTVLSLKR
jgi:flagellar hook protein FlgE